MECAIRFRILACPEQDADDAGSDAAAEAGFSGGADGGTCAVSFSRLYTALGAALTNERSVLLLYDLLHACPHFQNYVLVRRRALVLSYPPWGVPSQRLRLAAWAPCSCLCWSPALHKVIGGSHGHKGTCVAVSSVRQAAAPMHVLYSSIRWCRWSLPDSRGTRLCAWINTGGCCNLDPPWMRVHLGLRVRVNHKPCTLAPCSDLDTLLLPLLRMLYGAAGRAPSHLYMLLIILLILTQDASFAANVHTVGLWACLHWLLGKFAAPCCRLPPSPSTFSPGMACALPPVVAAHSPCIGS